MKSNVADSTAGEGHGFRFACSAIERTTKEATSGCNGCWRAGLITAGVVNFAGRVGSSSCLCRTTARCVMNDAMDDEGGVQLSLAPPPHHTEVFAILFLDDMHDLGPDGKMAFKL
ncbi:hypothetical protein QJS10_CPB19g01427 [Acorus calamus]|uniref:Uncharacterized protein n=1 Tax=Acorus calamus TaxID=4465 RepID=A0AAV9CD95_ACOCL|nr:hypothetical protein QJS10_CPB19g01427 [Acorus calamus]